MSGAVVSILPLVLFLASCARHHLPATLDVHPGGATYIRLIASARLEGELEPCT